MLRKTGLHFTKICKSYKFVTLIVKHRFNEFVERKLFVQIFMKWTADPFT